MTSLEKAEQLYDLFCRHALDRIKARDVAISCVNEIIKAVDDFDNELYEHEGVRLPTHKVYYENVRSYLMSIE